jgi:D-alanyl-D-alanine carboxypeptidase
MTRKLLLYSILLIFIALFALLACLNASQLIPALADNTNDNPPEVVPHQENLGQPSQGTSKNIGESWMLVLVSAGNPLPSNHIPQLAATAQGYQFDERAASALDAMLAAATAEGLSPLVCSAYRSVDMQRTLFDAEVAGLVASGMSSEQADTQARKQVAYPGTSEHNLGLAVDIVSRDYQLLNEAQADTLELQWLLKHCAEYGFILRYPKDKIDITGIHYEPWHFRYVGVEAATKITEGGLCLEEYLAG